MPLEADMSTTDAGATVGAALDSQQSLKQSSFMIEEEQVQVSVG